MAERQGLVASLLSDTTVGVPERGSKPPIAENQEKGRGRGEVPQYGPGSHTFITSSCQGTSVLPFRTCAIINAQKEQWMLTSRPIDLSQGGEGKNVIVGLLP